MDILMDTHVALWWVNEHEKLSHKARSILLDESNNLHISIASLWEIAIKTSLGKLSDLNSGASSFQSQMQRMPVNLLHIEQHHTLVVEELPFFHKDPFDRMLVAQAMIEGMAILTIDENIHKYDILTIW